MKIHNYEVNGVKKQCIEGDVDNLYKILNGKIVKKTQAEIDAENVIKAKAIRNEKRKAAYPPIADYLDAQVKKAHSDPIIQADGLAQEAKYLADCLAVKDANP